jgi:hypothetical protein
MHGLWQLKEYAYVEQEIVFHGDQPKAEALDDWLFCRGTEGFAELEPQTGLQLSIEPDDTFSEAKTKKKLSLVWYDSEGVEVDSPSAVKGTLRKIRGRSERFIQPSDAPNWLTQSRTRTNKRDRESLRYDDGATLICDLLRRDEETLLRVMSVVTDGMYLTRIIARYQRVG